MSQIEDGGMAGLPKSAIIGADEPDTASTSLRTVHLDLTDLLEYLKQNNTVSGIQRVVANLIQHGEQAASACNLRLELVAPEYDRKRVFAVDRQAVLAMLAAIEGAARDRAELNEAIAAVYASRRLIMPLRGDLFTIAGAFWIYDDYDLLLQMKRRGVAVVAFIHDLIQISHPEFVFDAATRQFRRTLVDVALSCAGMLTNSHYVADDVRRFLQDRLAADLPVRAVPLATELPAPGPGEASPVSPEVAAILERPYVLSVSTIEIRKNHAYMARVWQQLIADQVEPLPDLVFVGKIGWDIGPFLELLESSDYLGGKIRILNNVSDQELAELYRHASFTMYMSFVEGFGLPVAESLAYQVPCIASDRSSLPEVGGRFARYLDPYDVPAGVALVRQLIEQPAMLAAWRDDVAAHFRVRSWQAFAQDYMAGLAAIAEAPSAPVAPLLSAGRIYGMGRWEVARRDATGDTLNYPVDARLSGWHPNEDWGCWSASRRATIAFRTGLPSGTAVTLYAMVKAPPGGPVATLVEFAGGEQSLGMISAVAAWHSIDCVVGPGGILSVDFLADLGSSAAMVGVTRHLGLLGLGFCARDDLAQRVSLLEAVALDRRRMAQPTPVPRPVFQADPAVLQERVDADWYLEYYPDVQMLDMGAEDHYRWIGKRLGRKPNAASLAVAQDA